jgi:uncharacterized membrane protein
MSINIETSKFMAAIGSILTFLGWVPNAGPVLAIVGFFLILIGLKGFSEFYRDESIYRNAISGVIFGIVGFIALAIGEIGIIGSLLAGGPIGIVGGILLALLLVVIMFVFFLLMALSFRKSLYALSDRSGEHLFHTAGTLLFIGAVLTIIVVGLVLIFIAWIFLMIAFFLIRTNPQPQSYAYPPPPPSPQPVPTVGSETKYCPNCGAPVNAGAAFCSHCGKQLS